MRELVANAWTSAVIAAVAAVAAIVALAAAPARCGPPPMTILDLRSGVEKTGSPTSEWKRAVEEHEGSSLNWTTHPLTADEVAWRDTVLARRVDWEIRIPSLMLPFDGQRPIPKVRIVLGNQNGEDAFGVGGDTFYLDLSALSRIYGPAAAPGNRERLDRIFAHECTHVLQNQWEVTHAFRVATPYDRALRQLWREGLGNMYSLSDEWVSSSGDPTPRAQKALEELEPILVDRLRRLSAASEIDESELTHGLSSGPFAKKWGALPVALWLAQEAKGDGRRLRWWVRAGSNGVLELARKHLGAGLAAQLPLPSPADLASVLTLITADEPGDRLVASGRVVERSGAPIAGARIHVYQTDVTGHYTRGERSMEESHARLAGWLTCDSAGRFELLTIRPGSYPRALKLGDRLRHIPAHIHMDAEANGHASHRFQAVFADDSLLADPYWQDWAHRLGQPILRPQRLSGVWRADVTLVLD